MKRMRMYLVAVMAVAGLTLWGQPATVFGQEHRDGDREVVARLERMEHQIQQLAQRIEQGNASVPGHQMLPPFMQAPQGMPMMTPQQPGPMPPPQAPMQCHPAGKHGRAAHLLQMLIPLIIIINALLAMWVFTDIRKRGEGHGIFIVLALVAGLPGTILYALVRLGDRVGEKKA